MSFLEKILPGKKAEAKALAEAFAKNPPERPADLAPRDFGAALRQQQAVIAEVKHKSPSHAHFRQNAAPARLAAAYRRGGAAALSVVTDEAHFGTSLADVAPMRRASGLPVLVKDFVVAPSQILAAWAAGADAVLLIARMLESEELTELLAAVHRLGLQSLVECHDEQDISKSLGAGARILGINNRNLATLETDIAQTPRLLPLVPDGIIKVSESGLSSRGQILELESAGADAFLIGHSLLLSKDPGRKVRELTGRESEGQTRVKICGLTGTLDAVAAHQAGADILGMVLAPGPRQVQLDTAREIREAASEARLCGVFVDAPVAEVVDLSEDLDLDLIQLHGQESPDYCRELAEKTGLPLIKAVPFTRFDPEALAAYDKAAYFLVDLPKEGQVADVRSAQKLLADQAAQLRQTGRDVFLAGGLDPICVREALAAEPFAVDVSRGVEARVGQKDHGLVQAFINEVKR